MGGFFILTTELWVYKHYRKDKKNAKSKKLVMQWLIGFNTETQRSTEVLVYKY